MPPDPTKLGRLRRYSFPPYLRAKGLFKNTSHYGSSKVERIIIEIMITRKNRREPILL